jgi:cell division protein FtsZ
MLNLTIPPSLHTDFTPRITVIGVGGGGTNAVDNMIQLNLQGVDFVVANTDAQQLMHSRSDRRIQLGPHLTQGLGAGAKPDIGRAAAEEAADELAHHLEGVHMVFITAGMGGGTGTGAAPVIARMARERGVLTVGVVTKPFTFEGSRRAKAAEIGISELQQFVDTLIVIPNQNLFRLANERTGWREAFKMADHVLYMGVRGVTDLMVAPGLVNLDFADIRTVMAEMGKAMMGTGEADGDNRAIRAAEAAISNPLLEDTSMAGARGLLINITGGEDMTLFEVDQAANRIREEVAEDANIIFGSAVDESLNGRVRVSVVATGIDMGMPKTAEAPAAGPRLVAVGSGPGASSGPAGSTIPAGVRGGKSPMPPSPPIHLGNQATALAYAEPNAEPVAMGAELPAVVAQPRATSSATALFTAQPAVVQQPEPPPAHRPSIFNLVTGKLRGGKAAAPAEDLPDLRDVRRTEARASTYAEPTAQVRQTAPEQEPVELEIPAFLRRQHS